MLHLTELQWLLLIAGLILLAQCGCAAEPITLEEGPAAQPAAQERAITPTEIVIIEQSPSFPRYARAPRW